MYNINVYKEMVFILNTGCIVGLPVLSLKFKSSTSQSTYTTYR